jgi:hypothetical protein
MRHAPYDPPSVRSALHRQRRETMNATPVAWMANVNATPSAPAEPAACVELVGVGTVIVILADDRDWLVVIVDETPTL